MSIVPQLNDPDLIKLTKLINSDVKPIEVVINPEKYSIVNECFPNVKEKIKRDGGQEIIGWQIWKTNILIKAEFHAIWKSQNGDFVDITPKQIPISSILFIPDPQRKYEGCQVDNIRLNIIDNPIVDDFIKISNIEFDFLNKGDRKFQHGSIILSGKEKREYIFIKHWKDILELMASHGCNKESACFCGSRKTFGDCCYKIIRLFIDNYF